MQPKRALITGVNGQDGIFLSKLLLKNGYVVIGISSQEKPNNSLNSDVVYVHSDIRDTKKVIEICDQLEVNELYNLAAVSSVSQSFDEPLLTEEVNFQAPAQILEEFFRDTKVSEKRKFFQASSSEMFGLTATEPQNEEVPFNPVSPYAKWKTEMHYRCESMRSSGHFVTSAIMYNHESSFRPDSFLSKKVTKTAAQISLGLANELKLGNPHAERDWGFAEDHISAAWMMMTKEFPDYYVIATGKCYSVMYMVEVAFRAAGISGEILNYLKFDDSLLRPKEVNRLVGDSSKAYRELGWLPSTTFEQLIESMVSFEKSLLKGL